MTAFTPEQISSRLRCLELAAQRQEIADFDVVAEARRYLEFVEGGASDEKGSPDA